MIYKIPRRALYSLMPLLVLIVLSRNLFSQQPAINQTDLYIKAVELITERAQKDSSFASMDSIYWKLPLPTNSLTKEADGAQFRVIDTESILPPGTYIVFELNPIIVVGSELSIKFSIEKLIASNLDHTWICCEGCSAGGTVVFTFKCENKYFELEHLNYYNCF